jgi:hypothetical protein
MRIVASALILAGAFLGGKYLDHLWNARHAAYEMIPSGINGAAYRLNTATGRVDLCLIDKCAPVTEGAPPAS